MVIDRKLDEDCILCDINPAENNTFIRQYQFFTVLANFKQPTLGASLIVLNRHVSRLSEFIAAEKKEYWTVVDAVEYALDSAFEPDGVNYLMMANTVPHIHWHVVPRYKDPRQLAGARWVDENYGTRAKLKTKQKSLEIISAVVQEFQKYL
jgi:diadenosine tetraphosphate (Ap4A) HIT family hydrolase